MTTIDFQEAQQQLSDILNKKLMGEKQGASLERRAQKLIDNWWARKNRPQVLVGTSGLQIVGCTLGFGLGTIKVQTWQTRFVTDVHDVHRLVPSAIALGYANSFQLFLAKIDGTPSVVARNGAQSMTWSPKNGLVPAVGHPLRAALDRAKSLGYIDYLKGENEHA